MDALLSNRAEQEAGEAAMTPRSHHQEIARSNSANEDLGGGPLDDLALDPDVFDLPNNLANHLLEQFLRRPV